MSKILKATTIAVTVVFSGNFLAYAETGSSIQEQINENQNQINDLEKGKVKADKESKEENLQIKNNNEIIDKQIKEIENNIKNIEKEIEEILRTFDKAPSPSSENSVQSHFSAIGGIYD